MEARDAQRRSRSRHSTPLINFTPSLSPMTSFPIYSKLTLLINIDAHDRGGCCLITGDGVTHNWWILCIYKWTLKVYETICEIYKFYAYANCLHMVHYYLHKINISSEELRNNYYEWPSAISPSLYIYILFFALFNRCIHKVTASGYIFSTVRSIALRCHWGHS